MRSARTPGLSIHRMLIVFPLGLIFFAVIFDVIYLTTIDPRFAFVAYWNMGPGMIAAFLAGALGLWDWLTFPMGTRPKALGLWKGLANLGVGALFGTSWIMRQGTPDHAPSPLAIVLAVAAAVLAMVAGWLGTELLERSARWHADGNGTPFARRSTPGAVIHPRPLPQNA